MGSRDEEQHALNELFSLTYEELKGRARAMKVRDRSATLNPTALVNEAWVRLQRSPAFAGLTPMHFANIAAIAMQRILVEAARRRGRFKRGAGALMMTLDESLVPAGGLSAEDLVALDDALEELERLAPRQARMVRLRYFGGLDMAETAALLEVHESALTRDWRAARAFLDSRLRV